MEQPETIEAEKRASGSLKRVVMPRNLGYGWRALASVAVCAMGATCMWITKGETGVGWAVLGLFLIWAAD